MRLTLCALALGVVLGGCTNDDGGDTDETGDTSYEGMRVRKIDAGWRIPNSQNLPNTDKTPTKEL